MSGQVHVLCDVDDHEVLKLEAALRPLQAAQGAMRDLEGYRQEIIGRFAEQGFVAVPKVWETDAADVFLFEIEITGRTEPKRYDPDRQVHDVTHDLLGLGQGGVIKSGPMPGMRHHKHPG